MILAVEEVSTFTEKVGVPLTIAALGLVATLAAAAISLIGSRLSEATARRREGYANAVRTLVRYAEFPYRIRRRTSDDPEELRRLVDLGHEIQEALCYEQMWVAADKRWVGEILREVRASVANAVSPAAAEAWGSSPVVQAAGMNLGGWGPEGARGSIERFQRAAGCRFGWRRIAAVVPWSRGRLCRVGGSS